MFLNVFDLLPALAGHPVRNIRRNGRRIPGSGSQRGRMSKNAVLAGSFDFPAG